MSASLPSSAHAALQPQVTLTTLSHTLTWSLHAVCLLCCAPSARAEDIELDSLTPMPQLRKVLQGAGATFSHF